MPPPTSHLAPPVITIDGPSASGKGTIAAGLAKRLGFHYLDSGAIYRVTALAARNAGAQLDDVSALTQIAHKLDLAFTGEQILLAGADVTEAVRSEQCGNDASHVAALGPVRQALLARQRAMRQAPGLVADGRDMGTVVFPDAPLKIFLTASPEVRAQRRYNQLNQKGIRANIAEILQDIQRRDARDSQRAVAPLHKAADAQELDTSALSIDQAIDHALGLYRQVQAK